MRAIKPLKKCARKKAFAVADIEIEDWSRVKPGERVHYVVGAVYSARTGFQKFDKCADLLAYCLDEFDGEAVYAHFGGSFDFLFFLESALAEKYDVLDLIPRGSSILSFDLSDGERRVRFSDSAALLKFSLRELTQNFKVTYPKQDIDYTKITRARYKRDKKFRAKLLQYLEYDVRGLYEVLEKFYSWPVIERAGASSTLAGQALRVWRTMIDKPIPSLNARVDAFVRGAYFGGRTEIFKPLAFGEISEFDVNSLYPFIMREFEMPTQFLFFTDRYEPGEMGFFDCEVEVPREMYCPPLGVMREGKYIFPVGRFTGRFATCEIDYARSLGCKVTPIYGAVFKSGGFIFREYVDYFYQVRLNAEKNSVDDILSKLLMNSLYGRLGLNVERENVCFDDASEGLREWRVIQIPGLKHPTRIMKRAIEIPAATNVAIPAWVTAQARIHMHRKYREVEDRLYYTDTDSLWISGDLPSSKQLGALKKEMTQKGAVFLLPKTYVAGHGKSKKIRMKGFEAKKCRKFTFEDFKNFLEGSKKSLKVWNEPRFAKFATATRMGKLATMEPGHYKAVQSHYAKRALYQRLDRTWDSVPIRLEEKADGKTQASQA